MSNKMDGLPNDWITDLLKSSAENAIARQERALPEFERAVLALRRLATPKERARALYVAELREEDWYLREEAIWEEVNGCGHSYDADGHRVD